MKLYKHSIAPVSMDDVQSTFQHSRTQPASSSRHRRHFSKAGEETLNAYCIATKVSPPGLKKNTHNTPRTFFAKAHGLKCPTLLSVRHYCTMHINLHPVLALRPASCRNFLHDSPLTAPGWAPDPLPGQVTPLAPCAPDRYRYQCSMATKLTKNSPGPCQPAPPPFLFVFPRS